MFMWGFTIAIIRISMMLIEWLIIDIYLVWLISSAGMHSLDDATLNSLLCCLNLQAFLIGLAVLSSLAIRNQLLIVFRVWEVSSHGQWDFKKSPHPNISPPPPVGTALCSKHITAAEASCKIHSRQCQTHVVLLTDWLIWLPMCHVSISGFRPTKQLCVTS